MISSFVACAHQLLSSLGSETHFVTVTSVVNEGEQTSTSGPNIVVAGDDAPGLKRADNIALGVGLGIGIPTLILTACLWIYGPPRAVKRQTRAIRTAFTRTNTP